MSWIGRTVRESRTWAVLLLILAAGGVAWYLVWHHDEFPQLSYGTMIAMAAFLLTLVAAVLLRDRPGGVWLLGLVLLVTVPVLLLFGQNFVAGDIRKGLQSLIYLYAAGAIGGLVLELLHDNRYTIELPSVCPTRDDPSPCSPSGSSFAQEGPRWHLGFLSRLIVGGLAGMALVTLIGTLAGPRGFLVTAAEPGATEPSALIWALIAGSAAPAVWEKLGNAVSGRARAIEQIAQGLDESVTGSAASTPQSAQASLTAALRNLTSR